MYCRKRNNKCLDETALLAGEALYCSNVVSFHCAGHKFHSPILPSILSGPVQQMTD